MGEHLSNQWIVGIALDPTTGGYWWMSFPLVTACCGRRGDRPWSKKGTTDDPP
jgi:hypothetical protein